MLRGEPDAGSLGGQKAVHRRPVEHHKVLLFVAPPGSVSDALAAAVEREFEWISVQIVPDLATARDAFSAPVQLILVDETHFNDLLVRWQEIEEAHPAASIAITVSHRAMCLDAHHRVAAGRAIRGIVPMDVNLDIWLSVIRIMLKGGEYFPPQLFHRDTTEFPALSNEASSRELKPEGSGPVVKGLTNREQQVLSCVAKGLQNKLIAAELSLSEHTVKIHIHNIIRKLGAHNRTEAAALYFHRTAEAEARRTASSEVRL